MEKLSMRKIPLGAGYFRYEAVKGSIVVAQRVSRREYVAAFIEHRPFHKDGYVINKMFGRWDLFEKALSKAPNDLYATAELTLEMH